MRALLPEPVARVEIADAYANPPGVGVDRPFVRCNMISSLDGAISVQGRSGMLGGPADGRVFATLRSLADVVLVGAGTVRSEGYGPVRLDDEQRRQRANRAQSSVPPIAVVTRSANLDWSSPFFTEAETRPIIITTSGSDREARPRGETVADFVVAGDDRVDPHSALDYFHGAGYRSVLLEGGPGLNAEVVEAGLVNELCLTVAPRLVAGGGPRVLAGPELAAPLRLEIAHLLEEDGFLFYRFHVPTPEPRPNG